MARVFWDTNLFIYLFEDRPAYADRVLEIRRSMIDRGDELVTSALTVGEILAGPYRMNRPDVARQYERFFDSYSVTVLTFGTAEGRAYAKLRAHSGLSAADSVQVASAACARCELFVTNDRRLAGLKVDGVGFFASLQTCPL